MYLSISSFNFHAVVQVFPGFPPATEGQLNNEYFITLLLSEVYIEPLLFR